MRGDELLGFGEGGFFYLEEVFRGAEVAESLAFRVFSCRFVELFLQEEKRPTKHEDVVGSASENAEIGELRKEILADDEMLDVRTELPGVGFCQSAVTVEESVLQARTLRRRGAHFVGLMKSGEKGLMIRVDFFPSVLRAFQAGDGDAHEGGFFGVILRAPSVEFRPVAVEQKCLLSAVMTGAGLRAKASRVLAGEAVAEGIGGCFRSESFFFRAVFLLFAVASEMEDELVFAELGFESPIVPGAETEIDVVPKNGGVASFFGQGADDDARVGMAFEDFKIAF